MPSDGWAYQATTGIQMKINFTKVLCVLTGLFCLQPALTLATERFAEVRNSVMQAPKAPLISRQDFNKQVPLQQVILAPNGDHLAYQIASDRFTQIWRYDIQSQLHESLLSVKRIEEMHWAADSQHLYYVASNTLYLADSKAKRMAEKLYDLSNINLEFLRPDPDNSDVFWLSRYLPRKKLHTLVRANTDGTEKTVFTSQYPLNGFFTKNAELLLVKQWVDDQINIGKVSNGAVSSLLKCRVLAPCHVHHWDKSREQLMVSAYFDQDVLSLFSINTKTGKRVLIHQDPAHRFDIGRVAISTSGVPLFVSYQTNYAHHYALTNTSQDVLASIQEKTNSKLLHLSVSQTKSTWLVIDADPQHTAINFHIYSPKDNRWQSPFSHIQTARMNAQWAAPRIPFWYTATDGMQLQGYLTLPLGIDPSKAPLVVNPHGGPWNRSGGEFNRQAQFLANRGYAVFEPNFRASTGLGREYLFSANKDFGKGRVQQDIIDGLDYLLAQGIGDPDRLAIAGHSFGGFSALTALAFTPERFQMGFAGAAPSNLGNTVRRFNMQMPPAQANRNQPRFKALMVDIDNSDDEQRLFAQSPDKHWQNITRPLYMWAGGNDERVAVEDIQSMALRLEDNARSVVLISDPKEGHSPERDIAREAYFYLLEHSLAKHLGGRADQTISPKLQRYLEKHTLIDTVGLGANALVKSR